MICSRNSSHLYLIFGDLFQVQTMPKIEIIYQAGKHGNARALYLHMIMIKIAQIDCSMLNCAESVYIKRLRELCHSDMALLLNLNLFIDHFCLVSCSQQTFHFTVNFFSWWMFRFLHKTIHEVSCQIWYMNKLLGEKHSPQTVLSNVNDMVFC